MEKEKKKNPIKDEDLDQVTGGVGFEDIVSKDVDNNNNIPEPDPFIPLIPLTVDEDGYILF